MIDFNGTVIEPTLIERQMIDCCNSGCTCDKCKYLDLCAHFEEKYGSIPYGYEEIKD